MTPMGLVIMNHCAGEDQHKFNSNSEVVSLNSGTKLLYTERKFWNMFSKIFNIQQNYLEL
jgi:hypothetical protein